MNTNYKVYAFLSHLDSILIDALVKESYLPKHTVVGKLYVFPAHLYFKQAQPKILA